MRPFDRIIGGPHLVGAAYDLIERAINGMDWEGEERRNHKAVKDGDSLHIVFHSNVNHLNLFTGIDIEALNRLLRPYLWRAEVKISEGEDVLPYQFSVVLNRCSKGSPPDECMHIPIAVWINGDYHKATYSDTTRMYAVQIGNKIEHKRESEIDGWVYVPRAIAFK